MVDDPYEPTAYSLPVCRRCTPSDDVQPGQSPATSDAASDPREVAALAKHYGVSAESMRSFLDDDPDTSDDASEPPP